MQWIVGTFEVLRSILRLPTSSVPPKCNQEAASRKLCACVEHGLEENNSSNPQIALGHRGCECRTARKPAGKRSDRGDSAGIVWVGWETDPGDPFLFLSASGNSQNVVVKSVQSSPRHCQSRQERN
jgi:hypothetical protein